MFPPPPHQPAKDKSMFALSVFHFLSLPKEVVFWVAEREAKFICRIMDTLGKEDKNRNRRDLCGEKVNLERRGHFAEKALQLLRGEKELERKEKR